jgi:hypothetical protein
MANLLATGAAWLAGKLASHAAQTVTYRRGGRSVSIAATKGRTASPTDSQFGILDINECDWIITASLIVLGGSVVQPQRDDEIIEADGQRWHVLPTEGEQVFRPADPQGTLLRIHTKRITA